MITFAAPAKLNLTLEVLRKREDGYHEVRSLMQAIDLCDTLTFQETDDGRLSLHCSHQALNNADNLVLRAANLIRDEYGVKRGARIKLVKRIPDAGGLGGGSSDAAIAIQGLNSLWRLNISADDMRRLGARIGSDVPFFICGGTAVVEGRGEDVYPVPYGLKGVVVLLFPRVAAVERKTARLYAALKAGSFSGGEHTRSLVERLRHGQEMSDDLFFNVFDMAAHEVFDGLEGCQQAAQNLAGRKLHLSGSGPTMFAWCRSEADAAKLCGLLKSDGFNCLTARTL